MNNNHDQTKLFEILVQYKMNTVLICIKIMKNNLYYKTQQKIMNQY